MTAISVKMHAGKPDNENLAFSFQPIFLSAGKTDKTAEPAVKIFLPLHTCMHVCE